MSWREEVEYTVVANINFRTPDKQQRKDRRQIKSTNRVSDAVQYTAPDNNTIPNRYNGKTPFPTNTAEKYHSHQIQRKKGSKMKSTDKGPYSMCIKIQRNHHPHSKSSNPPPPSLILTSTTFPSNRP